MAINETAAQTAKKVRAALKAAFPDAKFSVRSKTYSGGSSVHVDWTDGPMEDEVRPVAKQFQSATFDPMCDLKEYHGYFDGDQHVYGADYIQLQRDMSEEYRKSLMTAFERLHGYAPPAFGDWFALNETEKQLRVEAALAKIEAAEGKD